MSLDLALLTIPGDSEIIQSEDDDKIQAYICEIQMCVLSSASIHI